MKSWKVVALTLALGLGMGSLALANQDANGAGDKTHNTKEKDHDGHKDKQPRKARSGKVVGVSGTSITIEVGPKNNKTQVVIETNAETKFKVNGKEGTIDDIKEGMWLLAKPLDGVATHVLARDPGNKKDKNKDKEKHEDHEHDHDHEHD
ncbi:MAG: hypothetical protein IT444_04425 [Phycisphaeraceae bacterium]|nr:hypothetical protein [Phycisphaeraceae bacterium]